MSAPRERLRLRLYVAGESPNSQRALVNLRALLGGDDGVDLEVIDLLQRPEEGLADGILVTPTLVKAAPPPRQVVIGDLSERSALVAALGTDGALR